MDALPAQVLAQRPDVYNAEREVAAASADVASAQAQRYPRLTLSGSVGAAQVRMGGVTTDLNTWNYIGPLALSVPIFDGGRRAAQTDAAQARYDEAASQYRAKVRQAVSEVEQALVRLQSTAEAPCQCAHCRRRLPRIVRRDRGALARRPGQPGGACKTPGAQRWPPSTR